MQRGTMCCTGWGMAWGVATSFEWPSLDTEDAPLTEGVTLTIEPAVYVEGVGSIKLEDMITITETGCSFLSHRPRELGSITRDGVLY